MLLITHQLVLKFLLRLLFAKPPLSCLVLIVALSFFLSRFYFLSVMQFLSTQFIVSLFFFSLLVLVMVSCWIETLMHRVLIVECVGTWILQLTAKISMRAVHPVLWKPLNSIALFHCQKEGEHCWHTVFTCFCLFVSVLLDVLLNRFRNWTWTYV